jgi:hypothetical protein
MMHTRYTSYVKHVTRVSHKKLTFLNINVFTWQTNVACEKYAKKRCSVHEYLLKHACSHKKESFLDVHCTCEVSLNVHIYY